MMPNWIFPVVGILILFHYQFFVHINAKSCPLRQFYIAVCKLKVVLIFNIVKYAFTHIVVDTDALLLNDRIIAGSIHIQAGSKGNRSQGQ